MDVITSKLADNRITFACVGILIVMIIFYIMWGVGKAKEKFLNRDSSIIRTGGNAGGAVLNLVETTQPGQGPQENVYRAGYANWWLGRENFSDGTDINDFLQLKTPAGDRITAVTRGLSNRLSQEERAKLTANNLASYEECVARTGNPDMCSVPAVNFVRANLSSQLLHP